MSGQTLIPCPHCGKEYKTQGMSSHIFRCKENPDRVEGQLKTDYDILFCENSSATRKNVRRRIINDDLIEYFCHICGIGPEWNDKPMPLILDHINGVNNDNRLENLRFICSNCDSQLDTYKGKNIGR